LLFSKDLPELAPYIKDTKGFLRKMLSKGERVILEGTQGYGLSLLHSPHYPYVTSRDTTAAAFVSEAGLSPIDVDDVVLTIRAFPIRVAGNSGPLQFETDWATVTKRSGSQLPLSEYTSVTKRLRRIGRFDSEIVKRSIQANRPTRIVLNHLDYAHWAARISRKTTATIQRFVDFIQNEISQRIDFFGWSPSHMKAADLSIHISLHSAKYHAKG
jgi:adenylosuccinate synthase